MDATKIVSLIVLGLMFAFVIWRYYETNRGETAVKEFLNSIADKIEGIILDGLEEIDFGDFSNISEIEQKILNNIIDQVFEIVKNAMVNEITDRFTKILVEKYLTKEIIESFVQHIFMSNAIQTVYTQKYNQALVTSSMAVKYVDPEALEDETVAENLKILQESIDPKANQTDWAAIIDAEEMKDVVLNPVKEDGTGIVEGIDEEVNEDE